MNITHTFKRHGIFNDEDFEQVKMLALELSVRCLRGTLSCM